MIRKSKATCILLISAICAIAFANNSIPSLEPYTAIINLDLPPSQRYVKLSQQKSDYINKFIQYLHQGQQFAIAFKITKIILFLLPQFAVKYWIGSQFYQECKGVAKGTRKHISQIIVFNYMYELGAWTQFCTSIPITQRIVSKNQTQQNLYNIDLLARNLDYGYQQFLSQNSIRFQYYKDGEKIFTSICHAGIVGTHTSLRYRSGKGQNKHIQYAITLNQRIQGGLHLTLAQIFTSRCERPLQVIMRLQKSGSKSVQQLIKQLSESNTCAGVYFMVHTEDGQNIIIEKNRGKTINKIIRNSVNTTNSSGQNQSRKIAFLLQTNTDSDKPDPDTRRTIGTERMNALVQQERFISKNDVKNVLLQYPNFNPYTLMTALMDVKNGQVQVLVWTKDSFEQSGQGQ